MKIPPINITAASASHSIRNPKEATAIIKQAFKDLAQKFATIPEIGRFKSIQVTIPIATKPHQQASKAIISIEPSVLPEDYRTRVLTFTVKTASPICDAGITHEMSPASGNKFSIESTLRNPKIIKLFADFIKSTGA